MDMIISDTFQALIKWSKPFVYSNEQPYWIGAGPGYAVIAYLGLLWDTFYVDTRGQRLVYRRFLPRDRYNVFKSIIKRVG